MTSLHFKFLQILVDQSGIGTKDCAVLLNISEGSVLELLADLNLEIPNFNRLSPLKNGPNKYIITLLPAGKITAELLLASQTKEPTFNSMKKFTDPGLYILHFIVSRGGTANLIQLDGKQFTPAMIRYSTIDELIATGSIARIPTGFKNSSRITQKGVNDYYNRIIYASLEILKKAQNSFMEMGVIMDEIGFPNPDSETIELVQAELIKRQLVHRTEEGGLMINEKGSAALINKKMGIEESLVQVASITSNHINVGQGIVFNQSPVTQSELSDLATIRPQQAEAMQASKTNQPGTWVWRILSSNWTITIIGGIVVYLLCTLIAKYFK